MFVTEFISPPPSKFMLHHRKRKHTANSISLPRMPRYSSAKIIKTSTELRQISFPQTSRRPYRLNGMLAPRGKSANLPSRLFPQCTENSRSVIISSGLHDIVLCNFIWPALLISFHCREEGSQQQEMLKKAPGRTPASAAFITAKVGTVQIKT